MKLKHIVITGCISFFALLVFSLLFYKERTILNDIAFHIFYFARDRNFAIQNNRFGAVFTQVFGVVPAMNNASLTTIMISYSAGFVIIDILIFLVIGIGFKNRELALIMLLWPLLFVSHTFYWMLSELNQGIAFMLLFFAFYQFVQLKHKGSPVWNTGLILLLAFLSGFHPLLFIPVTFVCLFYILHNNLLRKKEGRNLMGVAIIYFLLIVLKSLLVKIGGYGYEAGTLGGMKNFIKLFPDYFSIQSNKDFVSNCLRLYYFIPVLFTLNVVYYIRRKLKLKLILFIAFFLGYLAIVNICYFENTPPYYIENLYLPLSIFLLFPFVYDVLPALKPGLAIVLILLICGAGIIRSYTTHRIYTAHYVWQKNYLDANPNKKLIVDNNLVPMDTLMDTWATPYEFWLLSTSETGKSASILFTDSVKEYYYWLPENKMFFTRIDIMYPYEELQPPYFVFTDTSRYTVRKSD